MSNAAPNALDQPTARKALEAVCDRYSIHGNKLEQHV
jgi:hypothetical protein